MQKAKYLAVAGLLLLGAGCAKSPTVTPDTTPLSPKAIDTQKTTSFILGPDLPTVSTDARDPKNEFTTTNVDLNGDGTKETIVLTEKYSPETGNVATLIVNGTIVATAPGTNPQNYFGIVDINKADKQKEIALGDEGPSTDYTTTYFAFDGKKLNNLGTVSDLWENTAFDGKGSFVVAVRAQVLDTWFHGEKWTLDQNNVLTSGTETFFKRVMPTVRMKVEFTFKDTPATNAKTAFTAKIGDTINIFACDNQLNSWCEVENAIGNRGWFEMTDFNRLVGLKNMTANDVFEGLSNAD